MKEAAIVAACRTAVGKFGGSLAAESAAKLGALAVREALTRAQKVEDGEVEDVIMGQVLTGAAGQNPARQAARNAGLPDHIPAMTINHVCGSGLRAVASAAQAVRAGDASVVVAGGQENMSSAPHALIGSRSGFRMGDAKLVDMMVLDGLTDAFGNYHMGITAENVAKKYGITREEQDEFACASQQKASAAQKAGKFKDEIFTVEVPQRRGEALPFADDEFIRHDASVESLAKLRPAFDKDGTVTAGNASGINDGAAAFVIMDADEAARRGCDILATIKGGAWCGLDPALMGMGPAPAAKKCLQKCGWKAEDVGLMEINEAFAAQAAAVNKEMAWDTARVNVNGGAIAIGHPIGASGARILATLLYEMRRRDEKRGIAALCIGGGMGIALAVER